MYITDLFEAKNTPVIVTYPGRFQPFHQGHAGVFAELQKLFGKNNVYILTSNDQSGPKSPFDFADKRQLMMAAGVPGDHIVQTTAMYSLPEGFDPSNTIFVTAVGAPDADRLNPDSVLKRDKKDKEGNIIKPAGSPGYYKTWGGAEQAVTADQHGYVVVIPEIHKEVNIKGKTYDVSHGTECRNLWNAIRGDAKARSEFLSQLYGRADAKLAQIFDKIPAPVAEEWSQKYKKSINCSHPKGFSQRAHCAGKKKHNESIEMEMTCPDCGMCETHGDNSKDTLDEACWKGYHKEGMKTMFGKKYPNCVKNKGVSEAGSPAQQAAIAIAMKKAGKKPKHVDEDAAGVGVVATNKKMARDPRYSTSMTVDVHPDTPKKQLKALRLAEMQASDFEIRNFEKLDTILAELCKQVIAHQKDDADYWGMVAACVVDPDDNVVPGINYLDDSGKRVHAERAAIDSYREHFGEIPEGSIIVTTLSPCCHPLEERYGESCTELINDTDVHKVYCGYKDPTQEQTMNRTFHIMQTRNESIVELCKSFADTFLGKINEDTDNKHSIDEDEMMSMVKDFLPVAMKDLKIKRLPHIVLQPHIEEHDGQATFGRFVDAEERIYLGIADRHPVDILRTLAHELVHFKQYEDDKMYPGAGKTGSPIENEAHVVAGIIMRHFNKKYPMAIKSKPLEL